MIAPVWVCCESASSRFARPKSVILGSPSGVRSTLAGFRSRWMMLRRCASRMARASSRTISAASRGRLRLSADLVREAAAGDELEREIRQSVMLADLVDLDDPRMLELGDSLRFDGEPRELLGRGVGAGQHHLQSDQAVEASVQCLVHDPHAASADHLQDHVAWQVRPDSCTTRLARFRPVRRHVLPGRGGSIAQFHVDRFVRVSRITARRRHCGGVHRGHGDRFPRVTNVASQLEAQRLRR